MSERMEESVYCWHKWNNRVIQDREDSWTFSHQNKEDTKDFNKISKVGR